MSSPSSTDDNSIFAAWREQMLLATKNPFMLRLLLKQWQRVLKRLAHFYAQLASLPRRNRRALQRALATSLIGAAMVLALSSAPVVHAGTITVDGDGSGSTCSLADAITTANTGSNTGNCTGGSGSGDTIDLQVDVTLAAALPTIDTEITLAGNNHNVNGNSTFRVFRVTNSGDFTINDTTIAGGYTNLTGAGIYNNGTLEVNDSKIAYNSAQFYGGGLWNFQGSATLNNTSVYGNHAKRGGGIRNRSTMHVNNSTIGGNNTSLEQGAGIYNSGPLYMNSSTISGNTADGSGGGIFNSGDGDLELNNSTVSGNITKKLGGGIYNVGAIVTLNNSTVSGNSSASYGGGILNRGGKAYLHRSLISGNSGGNGIELRDIESGISYGNDYNLFGQSGETNKAAFYYSFTPGANDINATSDGDINSIHIPTALAAILDTTLGNNGGPTFTHALMTGSPALDKAPNADCSAAPINGVDQRGEPRNVNINGGNPLLLCDIGAFELQRTTALNVTGVKALAREGKNVIKWRTTNESQIAGFRVARKFGESKWQKLTKVRDAKHAGDAAGANYSFQDLGVRPEKLYRYKVQVIYLDGHREWTDAVRVVTVK